MSKSIQEQFMGWCRHFDGIQHGCCKLGIKYSSVRVETDEDEYYPCLKGDGVEEKCDFVDYPSHEEADEHAKEVEAHLKQYIKDVEADICPHCKAPIRAMVERGFDVYAEPCGHYLHCGPVNGTRIETTD